VIETAGGRLLVS